MAKATALFIACCLGCVTDQCVAAESRSADTLEEVIITARKREESASALAASLAVLSQQELADAQVRDLVRAAELVPGFVFSRAPDDGLALTLRGIGTPARSQAFDQSIALFLDDIYLAKGRLYPLATFDLERIEVLRGPQSTEIGKSASIGAIHLVGRLPGAVNSASIRVGQQLDRGGYQLDAGADWRASANAAVRLAMTSSDSRGWVRNGATGKDVPEDRDNGLRLSTRIAGGDRIEATLQFQYSEHQRLGTAMQVVAANGIGPYGEAVLDDHSLARAARGSNGESVHTVTAHMASVKLDWPRARLPFTSVSSLVQFNSSQVDDLDFSPASNVEFVRAETFRQLSQEFRVASPKDSPYDAVAGVFLLDSDWTSYETQFWTTPGFPPATALSGQLFNGPFANDFRQRTRSVAGFANANWSLRPKWQVPAGVRLTRERKDIRYGRTALAPLTLWNTVLNPPFPVTPLQFVGTLLDGSLGLRRELATGSSVYLRYSRGGKLGGFVETNGVASANPAVDARIKSERTDAFEIGIKSTFAANRIAVEAALFQMNLADFQDTTFNGTAFVTLNLPARTRGVEIAVQWLPGSDWRANVAVTHVRATADLDRGTFPMTQAPEWTGNAALERRWQLSNIPGWQLRARADIRYRSRMFNQRGALFPSEPHTTLGALLELTSGTGRWGLALSGRNLTNDISADFAGPTPDPLEPPSAAPAELRSLLLSIWKSL